MEKVWRRVNQGLSSKSKTNTIPNPSADTGTLAGFGDGQSIPAVSGVSGSLRLGCSTTTGRRLATSGQPTIQVNPVPSNQHVASTASSERRRRKRKKSRPRKTGDRPQQMVDVTALGGNAQSTDHSQKQLPSRMNTNSMPPLPPLPNQIANSSGGTADTSLRQRAVAKLRLFNFHLNWDLHMTQCKPCGPRSSGNIITRRLCRNRRREDNELYRSNSFKFERFERRDGTDNAGTLTKQISVCDDYSLPIDFVKKRPSSFDPCLADSIPDNWTAPSPLSEHVSFLDPPTIIPHPHHFQQQVKLVEGYSDPKDSRKLNRSHHRKNRKDKRTRYTSDSSAPKSSDEDENLSNKFPELNSPDSISEDLIRPLQPHKSPKKLQTPDISKRNPSPYYYSDLLKAKEESKEVELRPRESTASEPPQSTNHLDAITYKKSVSLDVPEIEREVPVPKRYSVTEEGVRIIRCNSPSTTTSEDSDCSECQKRREWHARALALVRETCNISSQGLASGPTIEPIIETNKSTNKDSSMPPHRLLGPAVCACTAPAIGEDVDEFFRPRSIFYVHQQGSHECEDCAVNDRAEKVTTTDFNNDEMSSGRTRQIYETAFDCKIARSDDDLDEVDRLTSHSVMLQTNNGNLNEKKVEPEKTKPSSSRLERKRIRSVKAHSNVESSEAVTTLSQDLERVRIESSVDNINNANASTSLQTPIRRYTPSPPSTAPLPVKFPGKHERDRFFMNSIRSAPNLPASNPSHSRLKDLRLPLHSIRHQQEMPTGSNGSIGESSYNPPARSNKSRPRSVVLESGRVIELRKSHHSSQRRGRDYSSTESMATSSSEGSMESLRSSTSEGNRSTTSSGSRQSTSLSSHSSDSGHNICIPIRAPVVLHSKLHILSPISDKSLQEPASESSEQNPTRHTNSQKVSPSDETHKFGSDDLNRPKDDQIITDNIPKQQKRKTFPNKTLLHLTEEIIGSDSGISLHSREDGRSTQSALPKYALPKLNLAAEKTEPNSSGNVLPQDLRDLPFDMPKLRRRKLLLPQDNCTSGSATSVDLGDLPFDMPKLRRRLRLSQPQTTNILVHSTESSGISQASSSFSVRDDHKPIGLDNSMFRQNLTLNLNEPKSANKFGSLDLKGATSRGLNLNISNLTFSTAVDLIDATVPLERQGWYHGAITRIEAENTLRPLAEGSFLVRNCESTKQDYSLSLKSAKGFMHMRIQRNDAGLYILGQFSRPFESVPEMIRHFCLNRLPVRGAEHMCLLDPVIAQLL